MIVGAVHISFALPLFILSGVLVLVGFWHLFTKRRRLFAPHTHAILPSQEASRSLRMAQVALYSLLAVLFLALLFASFNPRLITKSYESSKTRRICIVMDISGSMTIGFDPQSSPLPSYEKTRIAQAGNFIRQVVERRRGDSFCLVFFDNEQYVSRDFTQDASQITEVLAPANLVGAFNLSSVPEAVRLKEDAGHKGTRAEQGLEFAKDFIISHENFSGEEIILYVGDLERQSGGIDTSVAQKLLSLKDRYGFRGYAVLIAGDYAAAQSAEQTLEVERAKMRTFDASGIPVYVLEHAQSIEKVTHDITKDIPVSQLKEKIVTKKSLVPWALSAVFFTLLLILILDKKFPRIP